MDIVDNLDNVEPTEKESVGTGITQEILDELYQSFYNHIYFSMQRTYSMVENAAKEAILADHPEFDPDNNKEHRAHLDKATQKNVPDAYTAQMMGAINGGLVAFKECGKRLGLNIQGITDMLQALNESSKQVKFAGELTDGNETEEPVQQEDASTEGSSS